MIEMMTKARAGHERGLGEEEFDIRGVTSERRVRALLRRKKLSAREHEKVEKEISKKEKTKNGAARKAKMAAATTKKKGGGKADGAETDAQQQDTDQKTFEKTLSTFRMKAADRLGNEDANDVSSSSD